MKKLIFFSFLTLFCFLGSDCKDEPTPPIIEQLHDTTSHDFAVTRIDTLGDLFSSARAVDIVDENNIWIAGIFTERDTNGEILYNKNLAHWDGLMWKLIGIKMQGIGGIADTSFQPLIALKVFSDSNIVVISQFNSFAKWDGKKWLSFTVDPKIGYIQRLWARSPNDIYFCGEAGSLIHYNGQTFTKINTGLTNPPLTDVWGDENAVYAVGYGSTPSEGTETFFLSGNKTNWKFFNKYDYTIRDTDPPFPNQYVGPMFSVFRINGSSKIWFLGGKYTWTQLYEVQNLSPFKAKIFFDLPISYSAFSIRGTADNDIYIISQRNSVFYHYNGITWYKYEPTINNFLIAYSGNGFAVKGKVWATVGFASGDVVGQAVVIIGKHQ